MTDLKIKHFTTFSKDHFAADVDRKNNSRSLLSVCEICTPRRQQRETDSISSRSHPRYLVGKRTAQKDTIIDITNGSQVNSNFPYRWSPASLTFNNYFYLFLYLYITRITINNNALLLKSPKNQNRRAALGRPAMKLLGGGGGSTSLRSTNPRP